MAARINIDLAEIPRFFKGLEDVCASFAQNQRMIDGAFVGVCGAWRDRNAAVCGDMLMRTGQDIAKFYGNLGEAVECVAFVCNNRADYVEAERISPPQLAPFTVNVTEGTTVENTAISTDPDALEEFKTALDKYIGSVADNVNRLNALYRAAGASWDDEQYEKFGVELNAFARRMQTQVDVLGKISAFLKGRIEILRKENR